MLAVRLLVVLFVIVIGCAPPGVSPPPEVPPTTAPGAGPALPLPPDSPPGGAPESRADAEARAIDATVALYAGKPGSRYINCSGVHITPYRILTAEHCLKNAAEWDGQVWYRHRGDDTDGHKPARMIAADEWTDLALIEAYVPHPVWLEIGENKIGDALFAVGHPKGIAWHLTRGEAVGWLDYVDITGWGEIRISEFAETNVPIKPGNSGGPLVNARGQLVGIASFYRPTVGLTYFSSWREIVSFLAKI
jgi:S1-C subfamily serine protease